MLRSIQHVSLLIADTDVSLAFYRDILGLEVCPDRPELGFGGVWLTVGGQQIHLLQLPNPDPRSGRPAHGGRDRHVAFMVDDIRQLQQRLENAGITHSASRSGRQALFCRDPDGNALEFIQD